MTQAGALKVRTDVSRGLLHDSALFSSDKKAVWEYVANGLQYVNDGVLPEVFVRIEPTKKKITIKDNGRGMEWADLDNFFLMHGENIDRKRGRAGRGLFGTGKCAAFGIANELTITTVRNKKRSKVKLTKEDIKSVSGDSPVPVQTIEIETPVEEPNGTVVEISRILSKIDQPGIIKFIERNLARAFHGAKVFVNNHECEFSEPASLNTFTYPAEGELLGLAGPVQLVLKVATAPLDEEMVGVAILSNDVLLEITLAGSEGRPMSQFIFGEIDVPVLQNEDAPIPAFDQSRSLKLNRENPVVQALLGFIGHHVDSLRRTLVKEDQERKASEEAKELQAEAAKIAELLNDDFAEYRTQIAKVRARSTGGKDIIGGRPSAAQEGGEAVDEGTELQASESPSTGPHESEREKSSETPPPEIENPAPSQSETGQASPVNGSAKKRSGGGFSVQFKTMGTETRRAVYSRAERTIYINLDHPQVTSMKGQSSNHSELFRKLCYEIAFSEYAIALTFEFAVKEFFYSEPTEPLSDLSDHIERLSRKFAPLFQANDAGV